MTKDEIVGLAAGVLIAVAIVVGYPTAGLLLVVISSVLTVFCVTPIYGSVMFIKELRVFKRTDSVLDLIPSILSLLILVASLYGWFLLLGWI